VWGILDHHWINVVADPRIASATAGSIDEMALINLFCKLVNG